MIVLNSSNDVQKIQKWIISVFSDPIANILLNNSNLTKIQLETLLIDGLAENILDRKIGYAEKSKMRLSATGVTRGAFNRTLNQAKNNINGSIYTILFLGYLGILETPRLNPLIEMSNRLDTYVKEYLQVWNESDSRVKDKNKIKALSVLKEELKSRLDSLLLRNK